jgi:hypothetical protein
VAAVFTHPPTGFAPGRGQRLEQVFEFLAQSGVPFADLTFGDPLHEAAARLAGTAGGFVDAAEQLIGD